MIIFKQGWYLIYTKPRHEKKLHAHFSEMNINCFLPLRKQLRSWHDRKKYVDEPLFPSYIFIYLNHMEDYFNGINTEGALDYVRIGKDIARVSESVVNNTRLVVSNAENLEVSDRSFMPGRYLSISKGALTGLLCEVVCVDNAEKVLVRVDLLRRNILLTLPKECLIAI